MLLEFVNWKFSLSSIVKVDDFVGMYTTVLMNNSKKRSTLKLSKKWKLNREVPPALNFYTRILTILKTEQTQTTLFAQFCATSLPNLFKSPASLISTPRMFQEEKFLFFTWHHMRVAACELSSSNVWNFSINQLRI